MASGPITNVGNLAQALATIHQSAAAPEFEYRFNQMQNTMIGRLNDEIKKVNASNGSQAELGNLRREGKKLSTMIPAVDKYIFDNKNNSARLGTVLNQVSTMIGLFTDDNNISAADLTAFDATRQDVVTEMNKLTQLNFPSITDGDIIRRLKNTITSLQALTPVSGVVDPAGTTPATNANRDVLTSLEALSNQVSTAQTVTNNTVYTAFSMREDMLSKASEIEVAVTTLNIVEQQKKSDEVQALKDKYANVLRTISLSYEISSQYAGNLNKKLSAPIPEQGSILNLFT